jgi:DMSO/TMAO reductase YedYZ molybdopterin-dependent catalytic subunit
MMNEGIARVKAIPPIPDRQGFPKFEAFPGRASTISPFFPVQEPRFPQRPVATPTVRIQCADHARSRLRRRDSRSHPAGILSGRLQIDRAVRSPFSLTYQELRDMPAETRVALLECAGNSRVFLVPQVQGAQWELGAAGNAEWTGVPLRTLLERAGLEEDACEIVLEGPDRGVPTEGVVPPGLISYARSIPRAKALQREVLIAYQMNGQDLSQDHGYPVRAIVPGHYAMASVKWLTRIYAVREPFQGYWQTSDYGYWDYVDGQPVRRPLGEIKLKSEIFRPTPYQAIAPNQAYTVFGAAWAGETEVTEVSVSTDGGQTWALAEFVDPVERYAWRRWKFDWVTPKKPGQYTLRSRAKDAYGKVQPDKHDENYGTYVIDHVIPIEVSVAAVAGKMHLS